MSVREQQTVYAYITALAAVFLAFPSSAFAVEVGCFCTFVFVSTMFMIGIGATLAVKYMVSKRMWKLSFKRTFIIMGLITGIEVLLLLAVIFILQTRFYIRILVYLPGAFLLNYTMTTVAGNILQEQQAPKKRAAMAALSCIVLPVAVQIMLAVSSFLSNMITLKDVSI